MQSFKQYLAEENNNFDFWPHEDVVDWITRNGHRVLKKYNIQDFDRGSIGQDATVMPDGTVNAGQINLTGYEECLPKIEGTELTYLPCQFGELYASFFVARCNLGSLKGSPKKVRGKYSISGNYAITSIEYLPEEAGGYILRNTSIKSFSGIHKVIKKVTGLQEATIMLPSCAEHAFLGFLKIPGLEELKLSQVVQDRGVGIRKELIQAVNIVNKYLPLGNVFECQEELIDNDLKDYAEL